MSANKERSDHWPPTVPVQSFRKTKRYPEEKHRQHRTLACKQTGINHEVPGITHNLYSINRFWPIITKLKLYKFWTTGCNRRNGPDVGKVFLRSNYTDITQTPISKVERLQRYWPEKRVDFFDVCVLYSFPWRHSPLSLNCYVRANVAPATLATGGAFSSV